MTQWLDEKCNRERWASVTKKRTVTREWVRHTGGLIMRAGLAGTIAPSNDFHLVVASEGIETEYVAAAKNAALTVLLSQGYVPVFRVRLTIFEFTAHPGESSYASFYQVAHEVVSHLIGVASGATHNIKW